MDPRRPREGLDCCRDLKRELRLCVPTSPPPPPPTWRRGDAAKRGAMQPGRTLYSGGGGTTRISESTIKSSPASHTQNGPVTTKTWPPDLSLPRGTLPLHCPPHISPVAIVLARIYAIYGSLCFYVLRAFLPSLPAPRACAHPRINTPPGYDHDPVLHGPPTPLPPTHGRSGAHRASAAILGYLCTLCTP